MTEKAHRWWAQWSTRRYFRERDSAVSRESVAGPEMAAARGSSEGDVTMQPS